MFQSDEVMKKKELRSSRPALASPTGVCLSTADGKFYKYQTTKSK